jgi:hypothetical protein
MTRDHYRPFISALLIIAGLYFALLVSGCSTFQRQAKQGSDERNHCWLYSQLCTTDGTNELPDGEALPASDLALRCQRLDEDAKLCGYDCEGYLP